MATTYLDHAATTPLDPGVRAAMEPWLGERYGNPSARHELGQAAAGAVDTAREQVAQALGAPVEGLVFTSGATEANNLAVLGLAREARSRGRHILVGASEHPSVRAPAAALAEEGFEVEELGLAPGGRLDLEEATRKLRPDTVLVAQMLVHNEQGTIYPVQELARRVRVAAPHARLHVDAVQALGKLDVRLFELGADSLSVSAHKVHGPMGAGALALAPGVRPRPLSFGGGQEQGLRPGSEAVAALVGFGAAARLAQERREQTLTDCAAVRSILLEAVRSIGGSPLLSEDVPCVPNVLAVRVPGPPAEVWLHHLAEHGVYVGTGSACQTRSKEISPALTALGIDPTGARQVLRLSSTRGSSLEDASRAAEAMHAVAHALEAYS